MRCDIVVPTVGRPSLHRLLDALAVQAPPPPGRVIVVDDRTDPSEPLLHAPPPATLDVEVLAGRAAGPAAARNIGWRASTAEWVAFLDDDVVPDADWTQHLGRDLQGCGPAVAGSQGQVRVPAPTGRRPTDWERNVAGLRSARWATADMAYRRAVLVAVGGFDERFPRAYREDADLALRVMATGHGLTVGARSVLHPVRPAPWHVSITKQAGNADDALMAAVHGLDWRARAGAPRGSLPRHAVTAAAGAAAAVAAAGGRRRPAAAAASVWMAATASFAWRRISAGPRDVGEILAMAVTSTVIPFAAVWHRAAGTLRARRDHRPWAAPVDAVLFDRDGTLIVDVPYNGDPAKVEPVPGARLALDRLRHEGVRIGIVSNQSGVGRGLITASDVEAVNRRVAELLGPFDVVLSCPHAPDDRCHCRKPLPGLVLKAAAELGVAPERCAVVGDIGADVGAALAAGARPILVPNRATREEEVTAAAEVSADLADAVDRVLRGAA